MKKSNGNNIFLLLVSSSSFLSIITIILKLLYVPDGIVEFILSILSLLGIIITLVLICNLAKKHDGVMGDYDTDKKKGEMSAKFFVENNLQSYIDKIFSFVLMLTSVRIRDIEKDNYLLIFIFIFICLSYFIENCLMRKISAKEYYISSKDYWKVAQVINFLTFVIIPYFLLLSSHFKILKSLFLICCGIAFICISIYFLLKYESESAATEEPKGQSESAATEEPNFEFFGILGTFFLDIYLYLLCMYKSESAATAQSKLKNQANYKK